MLHVPARNEGADWQSRVQDPVQFDLFPVFRFSPIWWEKDSRWNMVLSEVAELTPDHARRFLCFLVRTGARVRVQTSVRVIVGQGEHALPWGIGKSVTTLVQSGLLESRGMHEFQISLLGRRLAVYLETPKECRPTSNQLLL